MTIGIKVCLFLGFSLTLNACATVWYVSPTGSDANSGNYANQPKKTIQSAIDGAANGDTVQVAEGTYALSSTLRIDREVNVTGAGSSATVLDGGQAIQCVFISAENASLNGVTVQHGKAATGAGIYCQGGTIRECVISNNTAVGDDYNDGRGGGVYMDMGMIMDSTVTSNRAISENTYDFDNVAWAGGIFAQGGTISRCNISQNTCEAFYTYGAGVCLFGAILSDSRVTGNTCTGVWAASGGGVYADIRELSVSSEIDACIISGNTVDATEVYTYSTASASGGGLHIGNGTTMRSTLVNSNTAHSLYGSANGAGVWTSGSDLYNCTVVNNAATANNKLSGEPRSHGGGVLWGYQNSCYNNIITQNQADDGKDNGSVTGLEFPVFYNCLTTVPQGVSVINGFDLDPRFANTTGSDYHLQFDSPCIASGLVQEWMMGRHDPDGLPRLDGGKVAIGAYAYRNPFWTSSSAYLGTGWVWNGLGFLWDGAYPFLYIWEKADWVYVVGTNEESYYLYDFAHTRWAWAGASFYPWVIVLKAGDPLDGQAVDIRVP